MLLFCVKFDCPQFRGELLHAAEARGEGRHAGTFSPLVSRSESERAQPGHQDSSSCIRPVNVRSVRPAVVYDYLADLLSFSFRRAAPENYTGDFLA